MAITDIFSRRYKDVPLRDAWGEDDFRFMTQAHLLLRKLLWKGDQFEAIDPETDARFKSINDAVAIELGLEFLTPRNVQIGGGHWGQNKYPTIIKEFLIRPPHGDNADRDIKERLSVVEQAFRFQWEAVQESNDNLDEEMEKALALDMKRGNPYLSKAPPPPTPLRSIARGEPSSAEKVRETTRELVEHANKLLSTFRQDHVRRANEELNERWDDAVEELNERLRLAGYPLHFHNGLLQMASDDLIEEEIHEPFWDLVSDPMWQSVNDQMLEALDRRDSGDRTAPFHAVSALESVIKIISDRKGWTRGNEKGAAQYITNLVSQANGRFIEVWEGDMLTKLFGDVRNPFGHGPGDANLPKLSAEQTDWAIDTAMGWAKSLIMRM